MRQAQDDVAVEAWADRNAEPTDVAALVSEVSSTHNRVHQNVTYQQLHSTYGTCILKFCCAICCSQVAGQQLAHTQTSVLAFYTEGCIHLFSIGRCFPRQ